MESLRQLEAENQQLKQRIQDLENAVQERPQEQWGNTMTQQASKALNKQVKLALEKTIDLRSLAVEPPKENAQECLRLMGMALKNLASAMNNTQALEAAAIILGSEATPQAIAYRAEQLSMLPQAVSDIRAVVAKPGCSWEEFWNVAQEYEVIKQDYWVELTSEETKLITALEIASSQPDTIGVGCIVAHADPYRTLYVERGEVIQDLGEELTSGCMGSLAERIQERDCLEDIFSAAPVAENEFSSTQAIPNQKIEPSRPSAELKVENSVSRDEDKANHEGDCSATDAPSAEKWSHEAIVARVNARPERMQKLKMAGNSGQNLGFDFLYECWDDPALQIVIKKLLVKYPQWKIAIVDRELVNWEG